MSGAGRLWYIGLSPAAADADRARSEKSMTKNDSRSIKLEAIIRERPKALVAFSGGVDSTLLLKVCRDVLGRRTSSP